MTARPPSTTPILLGSDSAAEAIVAGHICLDIIPTLSGAIGFVPGALVSAGEAVTATGGAVANAGLALCRLGVPTRLIGKVGNDLFSRAIREKLDEVSPGLSQSLVASPDGFTSYTVVLSPPDTDRMFIHAPGCNDTFVADDIDPDVFERAKVLHFGYPPLMKAICRDDGAELATIFQRAKAAGVTTSLDLCVPDPNGENASLDWRLLLANTLPHTDVFMPSIEEMIHMLQPEAYRSMLASAGREGMLTALSSSDLISKIAEEVLEMGVGVVGIKAGSFGLYIRTSSRSRLSRMGRAAPAVIDNWSSREIWSPCFQAGVVGTTGAGDATVAGFLMGMLRRMTVEQAANAACAVGGFSVEAADAQSGIRSWAETTARVEGGWKRMSAPVDPDRWRWDDRLAVWLGPRDCAAGGA